MIDKTRMRVYNFFHRKRKMFENITVEQTRAYCDRHGIREGQDFHMPFYSIERIR